MDLSSQAWADIAGQSLETIKGYMFAPYRDGEAYQADGFDRLFKSPGRVHSILDFACGVGRNFPVLRNRCRRLYGYDIPEMITACAHHCDDPSVELSSDWEAVARREYDLTVAAFAFQHIDAAATLRFYIESISGITDYLYVVGRNWRDGPGCDNVLRMVVESRCFDLVYCDPPRSRALDAGPGEELHVEALFRTVDGRLHRTRNEKVLEHPKPARLCFEGYDLLFDRTALTDERGIGRVNQQLLVELEKTSVSSDSRESPGGVPEVSFFGSVHSCPDTLKSPSVAMIHDVIPLRYPDLFAAAAGEWRERLIPIARQADYIATVSRASARDIEAHLGIDASRIEVVPNGVTRLPVPRSCGLARPPDPYLVYLGSDDPHKNTTLLFELLKHPGLTNYSLAMVGRLESLREHAEQHEITERVAFYGRLTDAEAGFVLAGSHALVFPSLYEGFGLPPFEAALLDVPSVCSDRPAMNEMLAGCVDFADPGNIEAWVAAIVALEEPGHRRRRIRDVKSRAREYSPAASAAGFTRMFRRAAGV